LRFREKHPNINYRRFAHMLNDAKVAFVSESAVYRLLKDRNKLLPPPTINNGDTEREYRSKPLYVHHHWHTDIAYIKVDGVFYFLVMMLDGFSRYILGWDLLTDMTGESIENFVLKIKEKHPHCTPMLITDNGSQYVSRDFKLLLDRLQIKHSRTRRNHPQTNGKIERLNGTVKNEAIRPGCPMSYKEAFESIDEFVFYYNNQRLHQGISFLRPADVFYGRGYAILRQRKERISEAKKLRIVANSLAFQRQKELKRTDDVSPAYH